MQCNFLKTAFLSFTLLALGLAVSAQATPRPSKAPKAPKTPRISSMHTGYMNYDVDSSVRPVRRTVTYRNDDSLYIINMADDKLVDLYVNGTKVPAEDLHLYTGLVNRINEQLKRDREQAERDREQAERDRQQAERDRGQADRDRRQAEKDRQQAEQDRLQAEKDRQQSVRDKERAEADQVQAGRDREQAERDRAQAERDRGQAVRDRAQAEIDRKRAEEDRALMQQLISDLVRAGIAPDEKSIRSVELDKDVFFVNGKKQPDALHEKFRTKFIKTDTGRISMHRNGISYYD